MNRRSAPEAFLVAICYLVLAVIALAGLSAVGAEPKPWAFTTLIASFALFRSCAIRIGSDQ